MKYFIIQSSSNWCSKLIISNRWTTGLVWSVCDYWQIANPAFSPHKTIQETQNIVDWNQFIRLSSKKTFHFRELSILLLTTYTALNLITTTKCRFVSTSSRMYVVKIFFATTQHVLSWSKEGMTRAPAKKGIHHESDYCFIYCRNTLRPVVFWKAYSNTNCVGLPALRKPNNRRETHQACTLQQSHCNDRYWIFLVL